MHKLSKPMGQDDPKDDITTYEQAWAYCQREGVEFSIWTDGSGARSLLTATLSGESASDLVKHEGPEAWRAAVVGVTRRLKQRLGGRDSEASRPGGSGRG